ncbi:hypothetical protein ACFL2R_03210 [Patescibacteria group bacterium]
MKLFNLIVSVCLLVLVLSGCAGSGSVRSVVDDFTDNPIRIHPLAVNTGKHHVIAKKMSSADRGQLAYILNGETEKVAKWTAIGNRQARGFKMIDIKRSANKDVKIVEFDLAIIYHTDARETYPMKGTQMEGEYYWLIK